ncbi:hypothetical protein HPP92_008510 [Vanilla planifolia]|uniref:superoxide dismutase n=1 Tax=Vanilla planifolia TaxID=51239 RepID=A0A835V7A4_VANPL|nr:hypothetical protein HPP92_008510 [Vanilla planifolia]
MSREYADEENAQAVTDALDCTGCGGASGKFDDGAFDHSSFLPNQPLEDQFHIQQLNIDLCRLRNTIRDLHSLSFKLDQKILDLSHELENMRSAIDNKRGKDMQILVELLQQLKDAERKEFVLDTNVLACEDKISCHTSTIRLACEDEISYQSRSTIGFFDLDNAVIGSVSKLNSLKRELSMKKREILSLRCQLDDVPVQTELIQYERRFSELYAQIQARHRLTRRQYAAYNALLKVKDLMLKEISLLDSINLQFKDAMKTPTGQYKLLDSMEVILKGTEYKLEKAKQELLAEQKLCDNLLEKHNKALEDQRHFSFLLKSFQVACTKYEKLRELTPAGSRIRCFRAMSVLLSPCCSFHSLATTSGLRLQPTNTPKITKERWSHGFESSARIFAYYGLTIPPYKLDALEPYMSKRTLELHWGRHHRGYVESLNKQLKNSRFYGFTMEELIKTAYNNGNPLPEFNNAAQVWNHDFFWESMQPDGGKVPWGGLLQQIEKDFGSFSNFKDEFMLNATGLFGSGWVWLTLKREEKRLAITRTSNAFCPLVFNDIPIIALDMWEHAYYLDYKDDKAAYVSKFLNHLVSWHSATLRIARAEAFVNLGEPKIPVA